MSGQPLLGLDERAARAAWTRLAEPGDRAAVQLVRALGAVAALEIVARGAAVPPEHLAQDGEPPQRAHARARNAAQRWAVRREVTCPERDLEVVRRLGGDLVVPGDAAWPEGLDDLGDAEPIALWVRGGTALAATVRGSVAVVGARAATGYGERVAAELADGLAGRGICVLSGGAYGIDAAAHRGALAARGATVAVLACGVDRCYPRGNEQLLQRVAEQGLLVGELPPGSSPTRGRFLHRNRLIAALSAATVVVEAAWRSGALSTAGVAAGLGRGLGAVPGPVTSAMSAGCHRALRDWAATCVTDAAEAAELAAPLGNPPPEPAVPARDHDGLDEVDLRVLDAVPLVAARPVPALCLAAGLPLPTVQAALGRLGVRGLVERVAGEQGTAWRRRRGDRTPRPAGSAPSTALLPRAAPSTPRAAGSRPSTPRAAGSRSVGSRPAGELPTTAAP